MKFVLNFAPWDTAVRTQFANRTITVMEIELVHYVVGVRRGHTNRYPQPHAK